MGSCAAPSAKGDDKFITTDYLQQCLYEDHASGTRNDRPGLAACLKSLREGDGLVVWKLACLQVDSRGSPGTELEFVIMVIAVSCVKLLSAHNST
uniref:recombinase family protein n=1 Tax=Escherichia coli TaxID=562 RepID=UPI001951588A